MRTSSCLPLCEHAQRTVNTLFTSAAVRPPESLVTAGNFNTPHWWLRSLVTANCCSRFDTGYKRSHTFNAEIFYFFVFTYMCSAGINTLDNWPGIPEVICSVEEYFKTRRQSLLKCYSVLPNHHLCFTAWCLILLIHKPFRCVSYNVDLITCMVLEAFRLIYSQPFFDCSKNVVMCLFPIQDIDVLVYPLCFYSIKVLLQNV
jgi:hypothetical protein